MKISQNYNAFKDCYTSQARKSVYSKKKETPISLCPVHNKSVVTDVVNNVINPSFIAEVLLVISTSIQSHFPFPLDSSNNYFAYNWANGANKQEEVEQTIEALNQQRQKAPSRELTREFQRLCSHFGKVLRVNC